MVDLASDFLDRNTPVFRDDVCFFISQSGTSLCVDQCGTCVLMCSSVKAFQHSTYKRLKIFVFEFLLNLHLKGFHVLFFLFRQLLVDNEVVTFCHIYICSIFSPELVVYLYPCLLGFYSINPSLLSSSLTSSFCIVMRCSILYCWWSDSTKNVFLLVCYRIQII